MPSSEGEIYQQMCYDERTMIILPLSLSLSLYIYIYIYIYHKIFVINHCRQSIFGFAFFALVLWHINNCGLFIAKSSLYIYIKYIG